MRLVEILGLVLCQINDVIRSICEMMRRTVTARLALLLSIIIVMLLPRVVVAFFLWCYDVFL